MAKRQSQRKTRDIFLHPQTGRFVSPDFPGAIKRRVRKTPREVLQAAGRKGARITNAKRRRRSLAGRKSAAMKTIQSLGGEFLGERTSRIMGVRFRDYRIPDFSVEIIRAVIRRDLMEGGRGSQFVLFNAAFDFIDANDGELKTVGVPLADARRSDAAELMSSELESLAGSYNIDSIEDIFLTFRRAPIRR